MTFINNHGSKVTDEDLRVWAKEADGGDFSNWEPVGEPKFGKYLNLEESEASTLTFVCPIALKTKVDDEAKKLRCTNSELIRMLVTEGLDNMTLTK